MLKTQLYLGNNNSVKNFYISLRISRYKTNKLRGNFITTRILITKLKKLGEFQFD